MRKQARIVESRFPIQWTYLVEDEDGDTHHIPWIATVTTLRGRLRPPMKVIIEYISTSTHGDWNIVERVD